MKTFFLSLITCCLLLPAFSQTRTKLKLNVVEYKLDSVKNYHKILIVTEGNMQSRMYVENLSAALGKALKEQHIECKYEFLGDRHKTDVAVALEKAKAWKPDAVLRFVPSNATEHMGYRPVPAGTNVNNGVMYTDSAASLYLSNDFDITLNDAGNDHVWSAKLSTVIETGQPSIYKRIGKMILTGLRKQNVLSKS
jgi:hypothetical protein